MAYHTGTLRRLGMSFDSAPGDCGRLSWSELRAATDEALVRQLRAGYDDALAVIVDRYQRLVLSVALRIVKDPCEAEDVVQTVFVDIFQDLERFDPARGTLKVWLLQYAYSRSINRRRYLEHRQFYSHVILLRWGQPP